MAEIGNKFKVKLNNTYTIDDLEVDLILSGYDHYVKENNKTGWACVNLEGVSEGQYMEVVGSIRKKSEKVSI